VQNLDITVAESNPTRVITQEVRHDWKFFTFHTFKHNVFTLSNEAHVVLDQINTALNREGVELQFNQSYRSKFTTNPLGKHYINS
jgi:hypothetical protein